jgi:23S rRNA (pseudouridine1915-N3)-methyltransferase
VKAVLLRVGRGRTSWADDGVADYSRRLSRMKYEELLIKPARFSGDVEAVRTQEAARILQKIKPGDRLIALDERGDLITTEEMAGLVRSAASASTRRIVFAIGGPYGHGAVVREKAHKVVALSGMVLNHELARVVLVEQLYRVSTLLWGGSYHH